jgi:hypothetical protein
VVSFEIGCKEGDTKTPRHQQRFVCIDRSGLAVCSGGRLIHPLIGAGSGLHRNGRTCCTPHRQFNTPTEKADMHMGMMGACVSLKIAPSFHPSDYRPVGSRKSCQGVGLSRKGWETCQTYPCCSLSVLDVNLQSLKDAACCKNTSIVLCGAGTYVVLRLSQNNTKFC